jgi:UDP-3-O-[3-hydroxymyristoyl] glucosamine N-acyltransferase
MHKQNKKIKIKQVSKFQHVIFLNTFFVSFMKFSKIHIDVIASHVFVSQTDLAHCNKRVRAYHGRTFFSVIFKFVILSKWEISVCLRETFSFILHR